MGFYGFSDRFVFRKQPIYRDSTRHTTSDFDAILSGDSIELLSRPIGGFDDHRHLQIHFADQNSHIYRKRDLTHPIL